MNRKHYYLLVGVLGFLVFFSLAQADDYDTNINSNGNLNSNNNTNSNTNVNVNSNTNTNSNANTNGNTNTNANTNSNSNTNSNANTNVNINSNGSIQTITGEVSATGTFSADIEKEDVSPGWSITDESGPWGGCNNFYFENNTLWVQWNGCDGEDYNSDLGGKRAYIMVKFDDSGNVISTDYGSVRTYGYGTGNANFCVGDDAACKFLSWAHFNIKSPRTLTCGFSCDQKDKYSYGVRYEQKLAGQFNLMDSEKVYKCEEIRDVFSPSAEWFGTLTHSCAYHGGSKLFTVDTVSPPTDLLTCANQDACLTNGTEYSLTDKTFGKGVQSIPSNFVTQAQNSLTAGTDSTIHCANGLCTPYASGAKKLTVNIPESTYFGQCRGTADSETVEGKTISTPEVNIKTGDAKIPAISGAFDFNVINRPPVASVRFAKDPIAPDEAVQVTCDIVDPDNCVDKIVKVKWTCFNDQGQQTNCFFLDNNGIWKLGSTTENIPETTATNPYRSTTTFRGTQIGGYAVTCEASDNDVNTASTGYGVAGVAVCNNCGGQVSAHMKFCAILSDEGTNKTVCGDSAKVDYNAYQSGIDPDQYEWKCDSKNTSYTPGSSSYQCDYTAGEYNPALRVHDKTTNEWVNCASQTKTKISSNGSCAVGLRVSGSNDDFSPSIETNTGNELEAKISRECLAKGDITWTISNGTKISEDKEKETIKLTFNAAGIGKVQASVQDVTCEQAQATVKDKIQWGN